MPALNVACGRRAGEQLLGGAVLPDAVFCANDLLTRGLLQEAGASRSPDHPHRIEEFACPPRTTGLPYNGKAPDLGAFEF